MPKSGNLGSKCLKTNARFEISTFKHRQNIIKISKNTFWLKMPKFGGFSSKFSKSNVRFEISIFEIGYVQNLVKIRKLILFVPKCPSLGVWAQNFGKRMSDLKSAPSK